MKRLTLDELKMNSKIFILNLEMIKGGAEEYCHNGYGKNNNFTPTPNEGPNDLGPTGKTK